MAIQNIRKKKSPDDQTSGLAESLREYLQNSTLHGLRYIGTGTLSLVERLFFALSFLMVVLLAAYFITNIYQKWTLNPVIIGLDPVSTNIKDIPFPAITICNMNQVKKSYAVSRKTLRAKSMLESICSQDDAALHNETTTVDGKWSYAKEFLTNGSQPCEQMIQQCKFGMQTFECSQGFRSVMTDEGLCCTFNAIHPKLLLKGYNANAFFDKGDSDEPYSTWTPEHGYEDQKKLHSYPLPVPGSGELIISSNQFYTESSNRF